MPLLYPKDISLNDQQGKTRHFRIGKYPAIAGREIVTQYPVASLPRLSEYKASEEIMLKLMSYVEAQQENGEYIALSTRALVDNHAGDLEVLMRLEWASLEYNVSFFGKGENSLSLSDIVQKFRPLISQILTDLRASSSKADKPPSMN